MNEHAPVVTVQTPRKGRVSMWVGFACISIGALIFVIWGVPALRRIADLNARQVAESNCRTRIVEQLDAANALLIVKITDVFHQPDGETRDEALNAMDSEADVVRRLGALRGQSQQLCNDDPDYAVPEELIP